MESSCTIKLLLVFGFLSSLAVCSDMPVGIYRHQAAAHKRLLTDLFGKDYDKRLKPVRNFSEAVRVNFSTHLYQIIEVVKLHVFIKDFKK